MKTLIAYRSTSKLTTALSLLISLTFMIVWLPFLRAIFDGVSYQWGTIYYGVSFQGAGVAPDFIFIVVQLLFYGALMMSLFWSRNRSIFYGLLSVWFLNVFGNLLSDIVINGDTMFHGDTLGVHISITWIIIPLSALALLLIALVINADMKAEEVRIPWTSKNRMLMMLILGPVIVQGVLFSIGEPHGITDQTGVVMAILQSFLIPIFMRPQHASESIDSTAGAYQ